MNTTTKFQVMDQDGCFGSDHNTLANAVLEAAGHDGFGACFGRFVFDEENDLIEDQSAPMRLFSGSRHIGNNPYFPTEREAFAPESALADDDEAMEEVAAAVRAGGVLHSRYQNLSIVELTYAGDTLVAVDGMPIAEAMEVFGHESGADLRRWFTGQ